MYCVKCGVKLADSEMKCPLCNTIVSHPDFENIAGEKLYPSNKMPTGGSGSKGIQGMILFLFFIPVFVCFIADMNIDGKLEWAGYVLGALGLAYILIGLPMWFSRPNPVIFVPCDFAAAALYLLYINFATGGNWFLNFAFPVTGGLCLITSAVVTLLHYLRKGKLYIIGGAFIALGAFMPIVELLTGAAFGARFIGWSLYPLVVFDLIFWINIGG